MEISEQGRAELTRLLEVLKIEKQEDFEQHRRMVLNLPLAQRREKGYTWYPVQVVGKGFTIGDRAFVTVERALPPPAEGHEQKASEHQFRGGKMVSLFSLQPNVHRPEYSGTVYFVDKNRMKIVLNAKDLPDWLGLGQVGVNIEFDERTYVEMEKALVQVLNAKKGRLAELRAVLLGEKEPVFTDMNHPVSVEGLNDSQNAAVNEMLAARDVAVVHGPPGTGKTTTLVQAVKLICETEPTVLVCAPSNTAADLLTERLAEEGLNVVRIGNISRVDEAILSHTLEVQLAQHPESKHIKKVKVQAAEARRLARKRAGREERKRFFQEAGELSAWANQLEDRLIEQMLDGAQVITCTLVGAAHPLLERRKFRTVVIDEAAQALEPATWIPITKASRLVLTGDPFQLPPTVKSIEAQRQGLAVTLIEKCLQRIGRTSLLRVQYRMHELIMGFSNQVFYNNALQADASVRDHRLPIPNNNQPLIFIDTAGCGFEEKVQELYQSRYNPEEFLIVCEHLYQMATQFAEAAFPSVAIISPYREQVQWMQSVVAEDAQLAGLPLTINTIDGFQGQERDVVYLSLVRSNAKNEIGFLSDYRRMNVAMTRARKQLIVVGDSGTIGGYRFYEDFLNYCEQHGDYQSAWLYMKGEKGA
ncbi:MAG TPA: AAA domain-containing protein [Saprospiraceae bacterium]|nr:AAA domain-containing protein [Saprospiraceae bacterium]HMP25827.1 AAA domain-containing protein [Saprospiraceae bacterium]